MNKIQLIATATFGLEALVAHELRALGYEDLTVENGRVTFWGDEQAICRCNLWLRTADRVLIKVGSFKATTFEELFQQTKALPWADWLPKDANFPVQGKSVQSKLFSISDCQAIVKKAIVEKMKERYKAQWFEEDGPRYSIEVGLLKDEATLTIDTSGAGLHKRGYRQLVATAPLKETLAAAMVMLSRWKRDRVLIDPFCGSGTIPIEAALIGANIAPGLKRDFAAEAWGNIPKSLWQQVRDEARDLIVPDELRILGTDINDEVLSLARHHAKLAGVDKHIHLQRHSVGETRSRFKYGYVVCNPPYGERLGEQREAEAVYKEMRQLSKNLDTWSFYVLTSHQGFEKHFGRQADKRRKLYNGRLQVTFYQFFGPRPPRIRDTEQSPEGNQVEAPQEVLGTQEE